QKGVSEKAAVEEKLEPEKETPDSKAGQEEVLKTDEDYLTKQKPAEPQELEIFGHKLFSRAPSTFAPIKDVPVSNEYIIGPGDEIKILMWGRLDATYSLEVDNEGIINFPKIGPLIVAGLTYKELKDFISRKAEAMTGVNVNVSMGRLRTIQVFALGEVTLPGVYTVSSLATVGNALMVSGGPTRLGSLRHIQLKRNGKVVSRIDVYDFLLKGDTSADIRLLPGDVIFVPQCGPRVAVSGGIQRPAIYELKNDLSLKRALELAGGFTPRAFKQRLQVERAYENQYEIVLDISHEELREKKPILLQDGDRVKVFSILPSAVNAVYLYGNILRPGPYAYKPGIRVLDILPDIEGLGIDTAFDYALIKRYRFEDMTAELIPFNLGRLLLQKDQTQNIQLEPLDEIYIFSKGLFEDKEYAEVRGEVRKPGRYLIEEMRIKDLILKAGDLADDAYLPKGELIRIDTERNKHTIYFDLSAAMQGDSEHNLIIQDEDQVIIHSIWEKQWREFVLIEGEVKNRGEYVLTKEMHLKDLLFKAGGFTRDVYLEMGHLYRTDWRTKEVTVHAFNVEKALDEDPQHNLLLKDQDNVIIHNIWEYKQKYTVAIKGMVNKPGEYPYASNMTVKDLILVGGNVRDAAFLEEAEIVRFDIIDGRKVETTIFNFNILLAIQNDPAHNLALQPMDIVTIKEIPDWWDEKRNVSIRGEVLFPGDYQIRKDERLSSLIERAGGYTEYAYLNGAVFTRESVRKVQQDRLNEMIKRLEIEMSRISSEEIAAALSKEDLAAQTQLISAQKVLIDKLKAAKASGRVVINLTPQSVLRASSSDVALEHSDMLLIPKKIGTVNVLGSVYNPTALVFDEKHPELKYYLAMTGGPTENAEKKDMYIIRANGTVISKQKGSLAGASWNEEQKRWGFWGTFENTKLDPGDTVLVPEKVKPPTFMRDLKDWTTILYQIAVIAGITIQQVF
ncbi:SLBB domain-containing protein, partial [Thermodesulfobacteriota bacterium]